ncbi:hypothetical protein P9X05_28755, partial [Bacillus toyonensis]|uniref:hypothetical protein n=1 Tax=Bacillus toyonensis TaxID=155322 RepID=UPI002DB66AFD
MPIVIDTSPLFNHLFVIFLKHIISRAYITIRAPLGPLIKVIPSNWIKNINFKNFLFIIVSHKIKLKPNTQ